jgi:hypothetical protein
MTFSRWRLIQFTPPKPKDNHHEFPSHQAGRRWRRCVVLTAAMAAATWSNWNKSPMTMKFHNDASCSVVINNVTQDGRGQAIKLHYQNGSKTDRERFTIKIRVVQNGTTLDGGYRERGQPPLGALAAHHRLLLRQNALCKPPETYRRSVARGKP